MPSKQPAAAGSVKAGRNPAVDAWFAAREHPQNQTMQAVRAVILKADRRMGECIKWSTPTFVYEGNLASFQANAKKFTSLMFHTGSEIPGKHPALEGTARLARTMRFDGAADVKAKTPALRAVVKAWCDSRSRA